jgi:hypothetical protein
MSGLGRHALAKWHVSSVTSMSRSESLDVRRSWRQVSPQNGISQVHQKVRHTVQARESWYSRVGQCARLVALALALAWPARASAQTFTFSATDSGSGTFSYGVLGATDNDDGSYTATSGYLIVISGANVGTYSLFPNPVAPAIYTTSDGAFLIDDLLYPGENPTLDDYGLLFTGNGLEINIWGNGAGIPYSYYSYNGSVFNLESSNAAFTLASTPAEEIQVLESVVQAFVTADLLSSDRSKLLQADLRAAQSLLSSGNVSGALGWLTNFVTAVDGYIAGGLLTEAFGQSLIDQATAAIDAL